jgi:hypothetical protein
MARRIFFTIRSEDGFWFSDFCILLRLKATSGNTSVKLRNLLDSSSRSVTYRYLFCSTEGVCG